MIYAWSFIDKSYYESGLPSNDGTGMYIVIVIGSIFIILGNRIKKLVDKNIKIYLKVLIGLSTLFVITASMGGRIGGIFIFMIVYLIYSVRSMNELMKIEEFKSSLTSPKYRLNKKGWILFAIVTFVLIFPISFLDYYLLDTHKEDFIEQVIISAKSQTKMPIEIDSVTILTDIIAKPNAISYQYLLHDVDTSKLSDSVFRKTTLPALCKSENSEIILEKDIDIEYSYKVKDSDKTYSVFITKKDCQSK